MSLNHIDEALKISQVQEPPQVQEFEHLQRDVKEIEIVKMKVSTCSNPRRCRNLSTCEIAKMKVSTCRNLSTCGDVRTSRLRK